MATKRYVSWALILSAMVLSGFAQQPLHLLPLTLLGSYWASRMALLRSLFIGSCLRTFASLPFPTTAAGMISGS